MATEREHFVQGLSDILAKNKAIQSKEIPALIEDFKTRSDLAFEEFLIDEGIINRPALLQALGEYYNVPPIDVIGIFFDHHLVTMFDEDVLMRHSFIPYERDGDVLSIIAAEPDDAELAEIIGKSVSYDVAFMVGYFRDIQDEVGEFYNLAVTEEEPEDEDLREERHEEKIEHEMEEWG